MRRSLVTTTAAMALLVPAGLVGASATAASTPPMDTTPDSSVTAETGGTAGGSQTPAESMSATIYDDEREAVATVSVLSIDPQWVDFGSDDAPDEGNTYVRVVLFVESALSDDRNFGVNVDHFALQDQHGFLHDGEGVRTAAEVDNDDQVPTEAELAAGESVELAVTFQLPTGVEPLAVYYDEDDRLVEIVDLTLTEPAS